jgi:hypothetical protein
MNFREWREQNPNQPNSRNPYNPVNILQNIFTNTEDFNINFPKRKIQLQGPKALILKRLDVDDLTRARDLYNRRVENVFRISDNTIKMGRLLDNFTELKLGLRNNKLADPIDEENSREKEMLPFNPKNEKDLYDFYAYTLIGRDNIITNQKGRKVLEKMDEMNIRPETLVDRLDIYEMNDYQRNFIKRRMDKLKKEGVVNNTGLERIEINKALMRDFNTYDSIVLPEEQVEFQRRVARDEGVETDDNE